MVSIKKLSEIVKAYKKGDFALADNIMQELINKYEDWNNPNVARILRSLYANPNSSDKNKSLMPASISRHENNPLFELRESKIKLSDVILSQRNLSIIEEIINNYKNRNLFLSHKIKSDTKVLFHWDPWTWKTISAYALAGELWLPVMHVRLDQLISSYLWETWKNIRKIFDDAKKNRCILFLDEFDSIWKQRDDSTELWELKRVVTVLLQNIDTLNSETILIAATNHYHILDKAVTRRFDYLLDLSDIDTQWREKLFQLFLKEYPISKKHLSEFSELSRGLSWSMIESITHKSLKKWLLSKKDIVILPKLIINEICLEQIKVHKWNNVILKPYVSKLKASSNYTYKELEALTSISDSTLHSRNKI